MIEKDDETTQALLKIRNNIDIDDYEKFETLGYVTCDKLTTEQLKRLQVLNLYLFEYEKEIKQQVIDLIRYAQKKEKDPNDLIETFFSVNVVLSFYLDENDPCYEEDEDNTLIEMNQRFFDIESIYGIADGVNHNDFAHWDEKVLRNGKKHVMYGDFHCWSFHGLYDHTQLQWEEILRIGSVEMNITMEMFNEARKIPKV